MNIALDMDSTLAGTSEAALDLLHGDDHDYTYEDIDSWSWGVDQFGSTAYLNAHWHVWTIRPDEVPTMGGNTVENARALYREHDVDIVTAHPDNEHIAEGKQQWLEQRRIDYDDFVVVPTEKDKTDLGYDIYIDDKPAMVEQVQDTDAFLYLIDHVYNAHLTNEPQVQRVPWVPHPDRIEQDHDN